MATADGLQLIMLTAQGAINGVNRRASSLAQSELRHFDRCVWRPPPCLLALIFFYCSRLLLLLFRLVGAASGKRALFIGENLEEKGEVKTNDNYLNDFTLFKGRLDFT